MKDLSKTFEKYNPANKAWVNPHIRDCKKQKKWEVRCIEIPEDLEDKMLILGSP